MEQRSERARGEGPKNKVTRFTRQSSTFHPLVWRSVSALWTLCMLDFPHETQPMKRPTCGVQAKGDNAHCLSVIEVRSLNLALLPMSSADLALDTSDRTRGLGRAAGGYWAVSARSKALGGLVPFVSELTRLCKLTLCHLRPVVQTLVLPMPEYCWNTMAGCLSHMLPKCFATLSLPRTLVATATASSWRHHLGGTDLIGDD